MFPPLSISDDLEMTLVFLASQRSQVHRVRLHRCAFLVVRHINLYVVPASLGATLELVLDLLGLFFVRFPYLKALANLLLLRPVQRMSGLVAYHVSGKLYR